MHKVSNERNINESSNEAFMGERVSKDLTRDTSIKKAVYSSPFFPICFFMVISFVGGSGNGPNYTQSGCILLNIFSYFCLFSMAAKQQQQKQQQ